MTGRCDSKTMPGDDPGDELREYASSPCYLSEVDPAYAWAEDTPAADDWPAIQEWRQHQRDRLRLLRQQLPDDYRSVADKAILEHLDRPSLVGAGPVAVYWPLPGEFDSRPFMDRVLTRGGTIAVPVIVGRDAPLEFWSWDHDTPMQPRGPWNIPAPAERRVVSPSTLVIPLLGFDAAGHRLGNGGGYFDRTLAALAQRPLTVGVGYETGRLETIHPQAHDVALDVIVTEAGATRHRPRADQ